MSANPDPASIRAKQIQIQALRAQIRRREVTMVGSVMSALNSRREAKSTRPPIAARLQLSPDQTTRLSAIISKLMATITPEVSAWRLERRKLRQLLLSD